MGRFMRSNGEHAPGTCSADTVREMGHFPAGFLCGPQLRKAGEHMAGKEVVNLIRKLREKGISSDEIPAIIEYIETHDPKEQE